MTIKGNEPYKIHLSKDKILKPLIETVEPYEMQIHPNVCLRLCSSIMSQQLSVKVAQVIYNRFLGLFNESEPTPEQILQQPHEVLRSIGLSNAKANYVRNVAEFFLEQGLSDEKLHAMNDKELIDYLTKIKGVGQWTAEMLLMFTMSRPDIFSLGDFGIKQTMIELYQLHELDKKPLEAKLLEISAKWSPFRTYACFYLWRYKDGKK